MCCNFFMCNNQGQNTIGWDECMYKLHANIKFKMTLLRNIKRLILSGIKSTSEIYENKGGKRLIFTLL